MKPILLNTASVESILRGEKKEMRRIINPQPITIIPDNEKREPLAFWVDGREWLKPLYQIGDYLYVKESWNNACNFCGSEMCGGCKGVIYKAGSVEKEDIKWKSALSMTKETSRIFLKITNIRAERLQDINLAGALAEGIEETHCMCETAVPKFAKAWDEKYKNWEDNPWVWVCQFERVLNGGKYEEKN